MHGFGPDRKNRTARRYGLALTVLLHAAVIALLWLHAPGPRIDRPTASPTLVMLALPSAIPQPAAAPPPPPSAPRKARRPPPKREVAPSAAVPPEPAPSAASDIAAATPPAAGPIAAPQAAAAPPLDAEPGTPPPIEYLRRVSRLISLAQHYPWNARQYGHQGDVIVRMHLSRDGRVLAVTLIRSSGHVALDAEARDVVWRIGKFPPFPFDYLPRITEFDIDQPVTFRTYLN